MALNAHATGVVRTFYLRLQCELSQDFPTKKGQAQKAQQYRYSLRGFYESSAEQEKCCMSKKEITNDTMILKITFSAQTRYRESNGMEKMEDVS